MMTTLSSCLRRGRHLLREALLDPRIHRAATGIGCALAGFFLSAASLCHMPLPLALGLVLALPGWHSLLCCLGSIGGYLLFWNAYGLQGTVWVILGFAGTLALQHRDAARDTPMLLPAVGGMIVAVTGVVFLFWRLDDIPLNLYLLRTALGAGSAWMFPAARRKEPFALWLLGGAAVLSLVQTPPVPWLNPGYLAAAAISVSGAFPAAVLAGMALDLSQVTRVPMTAVLCLLYLLRLIPRVHPQVLRLAPGPVYLAVCGITGLWDPNPLPTLVLGGLLGVFLPQPARLSHRRGETGVAQVRLEMAAGVLSQAERILLEIPEVPIDEEALVLRAAERACAACPARKNCHGGITRPTRTACLSSGF